MRNLRYFRFSVIPTVEGVARYGNIRKCKGRCFDGKFRAVGVFCILGVQIGNGISDGRVDCIDRNIICRQRIALPCSCISRSLGQYRLFQSNRLHGKRNFINVFTVNLKCCRVSDRFPTGIQIQIADCSDGDLCQFLAILVFGIPSEEGVTSFTCIQKFQRLNFHIVALGVPMGCSIHIVIGNGIAVQHPLCSQSDAARATFFNFGYFCVSIVPTVKGIACGGQVGKRDGFSFNVIRNRIAVGHIFGILINNLIGNRRPFCGQCEVADTSGRNLGYSVFAIVPAFKGVTIS